MNGSETNLAQQYRALFQNGDHPPDVFDFLAQHPDVSPRDRLDVLLTDQCLRWRARDRPTLEQYFERFPEIATDPQHKVEMLAGELAQRLDAGEEPDIESLVERFPEVDAELLRERLREMKGDEDEWQLETPDFENNQPPSAGNSPQVQALPTSIGRYRVVTLLGEGQFGCVYRAHDDALNRDVAIKVPHRHRVQRPEDQQAYLEEARVLASLDHPGIVAVHDLGQTEDGLCFVVSKFVEGSDLRQRIKQARPTYEESAAIIADVAEALHFAHAKKLVHRDIKPANLLLDASGKVLVADFGLALKEADYGNLSNQGGTPAERRRESLRGR